MPMPKYHMDFIKLHTERSNENRIMKKKKAMDLYLWINSSKAPSTRKGAQCNFKNLKMFYRKQKHSFQYKGKGYTNTKGPINKASI